MKQGSIPPHLYKGPSMNPTLRSPDVLQIMPYSDDRKIQRGDVIVFVPPGRSISVTHRVASVDARGIRTRGDNNSLHDDWTLTPEMVLGRVVYAHQAKGKRCIYGGLSGRIIGARLLTLRYLDSKVSFLLRPIYHFLAGTSLFRAMLPERLRPRMKTLKRSFGDECLLLMGKYTIGHRVPGVGSWRIRRPFRLFVDESMLSPRLENSTLGLKGRQDRAGDEAP
ncbi:MAG: hypothetical protein HW390_2525 [Candidatus Brocadiaceae bacterium]|nr:hypothetical protein [Candidatus Brocadiaceae bacterium]